MKIALIGSSGLIGSALQDLFQRSGDTAILLKRGQNGYAFKPSDFEGLDAVINLAGEPVSARWTEKQKQKIKDSRIKTTKELARVLSEMQAPPKVIINASAIGYYGDGGDKILNEFSPPGHDFLAEVVQEWEASLNSLPIRKIFARLGIVLSAQGGALKKMLLPFKMGLGGKIGEGKQFMSWIAIEDVVGAFYHLLNHEEISGPVNVVSPNPVRNEEFTRVLGHVLHRPTFMNVPTFAIRTLFGEMGEALLLSSARVEPRVLLESKYPFQYPEPDAALIQSIYKHH